jgi:hypothetical protein
MGRVSRRRSANRDQAGLIDLDAHEDVAALFARHQIAEVLAADFQQARAARARCDEF